MKPEAFYERYRDEVLLNFESSKYNLQKPIYRNPYRLPALIAGSFFVYILSSRAYAVAEVSPGRNAYAAHTQFQ